MDHDRRPKVPFVYDRLDGGGDRQETGPHGLHQKDAVRLGQSDQGAEFFRVGRRRLLHEDVFSGLDRVRGVRVVKSMGRAYMLCVVERGRHNRNTGKQSELQPTDVDCVHVLEGDHKLSSQGGKIPIIRHTGSL